MRRLTKGWEIQGSVRLYYEAWKKNPERLDFLAAISHMYSEIDVSKFQSEEDRQRGLFILVLYMNESLKKKSGREDDGV